MTIYITQDQFTQKAVEGILDKPEDRTQAVSALMEAAGGKLLDYYVTMGEYDFLIIFEGDDQQGTLAGLLTAAASGTVTDLCTVPAVTAAEAKSVYERAQTLRAGFQAAGSG